MLVGDDEFDNLHLVVDDVIKHDSDRRRTKLMDSFAICPSYLRTGTCPKGKECPHRHSRGEKSIVCKHWLRGLCKKDDDCEFLHMYDVTKLPPCHFFSTFGCCKNPECLFLHLPLREEDQTRECPWYARGFCRHGPACKNRHVRRMLCENYMKGFCPDGINCKFGHPKYELPTSTPTVNVIPTFCALCGHPGHKSTGCTLRQQTEHKGLRPLSQVTCYKCGEKGHYANVCTNEKRKPPPGGWDMPHHFMQTTTPATPAAASAQ